MKKALVLLLSLVFITGCQITKYNDDFHLSIDTLMNQDHKLHNITGMGYRFYLPRDVRLESSADYNKILYSQGQFYYLYVDIISYYHKVKDPYEVQNQAFYSKTLKYDNKEGYIEINKIGHKYLVEMMYNYAKIEAYIPKKYLNKVINDFCYILTSIEFNDDVIETLIGSNVLDFNEEKFNIFEPTRKEKNFLYYVQEYDTFNDNNEPSDNDIIDIEEPIE